jgi:hypothetical protein
MGHVTSKYPMRQEYFVVDIVFSARQFFKPITDEDFSKFLGYKS